MLSDKAPSLDGLRLASAVHHSPLRQGSNCAYEMKQLEDVGEWLDCEWLAPARPAGGSLTGVTGPISTILSINWGLR